MCSVQCSVLVMARAIHTEAWSLGARRLLIPQKVYPRCVANLLGEGRVEAATDAPLQWNSVLFRYSECDMAELVFALWLGAGSVYYWKFKLLPKFSSKTLERFRSGRKFCNCISPELYIARSSCPLNIFTLCGHLIFYLARVSVINTCNFMR